MPELPEVEVIRRFLLHQIGLSFTDVKILNSKSFWGNPQKLIGRSIISISRIGKHLTLHLSDNLVLLFHFKMTGQLVYLHQSKTILGHPTPNLNQAPLPNKSTRVIFTFSDASKIFFNDQRKFGWIKLLTQSDLHREQQSLGFDLLDPKFTPKYFYNQLQTSTRPVKTVLLDQTKFAGIGNIYANDALFLSHIHPLTPSNQVSLNEAKKLHSNILLLIRESIDHGGSTARDNKYIRPDGSYGSHQYHFRVYQKENEPCPRCQTPIKRQKINGRSSFFCPVCQKL